jgi:small subunit ribosomal protein S16
MVVIRLARHGSKNAPFYHLTVADRAEKRDGRHIERVGFYNPIARGKAERLRVDLARIDYWISVGARPSERVVHLIRDARTMASAAGGAATAA